MRVFRVALVGFVAAGSACLPQGDGVGVGATILAKSGSTVTGVAVITHTADSTLLAIRVKGATPGQLEVRLDEVGDCRAFDASSTGGQWALGQVGDLDIAADGTGDFVFEDTRWTVGDGGTSDVTGHALVLRELTAPGDRVGCGVLTPR